MFMPEEFQLLVRRSWRGGWDLCRLSCITLTEGLLKLGIELLVVFYKDFSLTLFGCHVVVLLAPVGA